MVVSELQIVELVRNKYPNWAEIHVQFHTHLCLNRVSGISTEGQCICSIEGLDVRRQFSGETPGDLYSRIDNNRPDSRDYTDLIDGQLSAEEALWFDQNNPDDKE